MLGVKPTLRVTTPQAVTNTITAVIIYILVVILVVLNTMLFAKSGAVIGAYLLSGNVKNSQVVALGLG